MFIFNKAKSCLCSAAGYYVKTVTHIEMKLKQNGCKQL